MEDLDLDELFDGPSQGPVRPARFAPKGAKFKPKLKPEPSQPPPPSSSDSAELPKKESDSVPLPKQEELGVKPDFANDAVDMDIELKPEEKVENEMKEEVADELMKTETGEDEVVREIDVYFTPSFDPNTRLYVLQYPLRPLWRPHELEERCEEVRLKPASAEVEVDLAVDVDSKNYDTGVDPKVLMKKQTLASSWKPPQTSGYAVGIFDGNKLHLNPVHAVVQLRPSMHHLDSQEPKRKASTNVEDTVKEEGKSHAGSKKSKPSEENKDSVENWVPLKYHGAKSDMAARYLQKMVAREGSTINFAMSSYDYLNRLCPGTSNDNFGSKVPSIRFLLTLPIKERFRTWFLEGPPIHRFDALKHLAPDASIEEVLAIVQEYARLVQGLWVAKTSLVYGTDPGTKILVRDYILLLFSKNPLINNSQLHVKEELAKAEKEVLKVLARERPAFRDWKLKEGPDFNFMKLNPSVVKKQEKEWLSLEPKINDCLQGKKQPVDKISSKGNIVNNPVVSKSSNKVDMRTPNGVSSKTQMSEEAKEAITKGLLKFFKSVKVCSFQQIRQRLRDMAVSESKQPKGFAQTVSAANSIDDYPTELQAIISEVAVNIHGVCVLKSSPDHPQFDPFRKVVIDLFIAEGPNAKLKKAPIIEAAKMQLKRDISNTEYQKVLQELCISQGAAWVLRSGDGNPKQ